jgi:hypothetical protein
LNALRKVIELRKRLNVLAASLSIFLSSCGGGDGSATGATSSQAGGASSANSSTTTSIATIDPLLEGVWQGTGTANTIVLVAALNQGAFWLIYGKPFVLPTGAKSETTWKGFLSVDGFVRGSISTKAGIAISEDLLNYDMTETVSRLKLTGNYAAGTFGATLTASEATTSVTAIAPPATSFVYSQIPRLESVLGSWKGAELLGKSNDARLNVVAADNYGKIAKLSLSVGGVTVQGAVVGGCDFNGSIEPRNSSIASENVFDFSVIGSSGCSSRAGKTFTGIGLVQKIEQGKTQFILMGVSPDGVGLLFSGLPAA